MRIGKRIKTALDTISGQYDCHASKLFWYTDLEEAKAAAERNWQADSFVAALGQADRRIQLCEQSIFSVRRSMRIKKSVTCCASGLCCTGKTVRPVPRVTIDFGDGSQNSNGTLDWQQHPLRDRLQRTRDRCVAGTLRGRRHFCAASKRPEKNRLRRSKASTMRARIASMQTYHRASVAAIARSLAARLGKN